MPTVLRAGGFRVVIFLDDHQPAHVHVIGDGEVKISLFDVAGAPDVISSQGLTPRQVRLAMQIVLENQALLLMRWRDIHG